MDLKEISRCQPPVQRQMNDLVGYSYLRFHVMFLETGKPAMSDRLSSSVQQNRELLFARPLSQILEYR